MDPMRALASLEFVSARGLETSDTGPKILANHVNILSCGNISSSGSLSHVKFELVRAVNYNSNELWSQHKEN